LSLCFNWAPRHEGVLAEWRYSSTHSLTLGLDGSEWSASRPGRFNPRESAPDTHWIGGCVGTRAVPDAVVKRKIPSPRRELNPRTPTIQPVAQRYTDWAITALYSRIWQENFLLWEQSDERFMGFTNMELETKLFELPLKIDNVKALEDTQN
jgi:hypothetical protein